MTIKLYIVCNTFIRTILFDLSESESSKITLFIDCLIGKLRIIEVKVAENGIFAIFRDFKLNYLQDKIFK